MKICIACSAGGHLTEAMEILPILKKHRLFFFTYRSEHLKPIEKYKVYLVGNPGRKIFYYIPIFLKSLMALIKERPELIISTGAGITVPISIMGKLFFGSKLIYVECSAQVSEPSYTGKVLYPFADLFFVQWKSLLKFFGEKAIYAGQLI